MTTDVASRGIDIDDLSHVFIFSTPDSPEQYIHRAGRTGRVGKSGRAISLISAFDLMNFNRLVKRYHVEVKEISVPTDEEVQARKASRIVDALADVGRRLPLEEFLEFGPTARAIAAHELHDRIVALLLRDHLAAQAPAPAPDVDDATTPASEREEGPAPPRRNFGGGRRRGPRRR